MIFLKGILVQPKSAPLPPRHENTIFEKRSPAQGNVKIPSPDYETKETPKFVQNSDGFSLIELRAAELASHFSNNNDMRVVTGPKSNIPKKIGVNFQKGNLASNLH